MTKTLRDIDLASLLHQASQNFKSLMLTNQLFQERLNRMRKGVFSTLWAEVYQINPNVRIAQVCFDESSGKLFVRVEDEIYIYPYSNSSGEKYPNSYTYPEFSGHRGEKKTYHTLDIILPEKIVEKLYQAVLLLTIPQETIIYSEEFFKGTDSVSHKHNIELRDQVLHMSGHYAANSDL